MALAGAFVLGLIYGSFLNVVIVRYDNFWSIITGRSQCPTCTTPLKWYDLIPLLSYISLRGKCRYCGEKISAQYPLVEFSIALLSLVGFYQFVSHGSFELWRNSLVYASYMLALAPMAVILFHDLYEMMIPDSAAYFLVLISVAFAFLVGYHPVYILLGGLVGLLPIGLLVFISHEKWMGEGDIKVALSFGLLTGFPISLIFLLLSFLLGGVYGIAVLVTGQAKPRSSVPFAPFLILGGLLALFYGQALLNWYLGIVLF